MDTINTLSNAKADRLNRKVLAEVKAGQIRLLYQHPFLIVINLLNAVLVIAVLWKGFPRGALLIWLALFLFVIPARFVVANLQARQAWPAMRAATWYIVGSAATGCLWGFLALVVIATSNLAYDVFIVFVLGGMTAGALLLDTSYLPAFFAFVLPAVVPTSVAFLMRGDLMSVAMGLMITVFALVLMAVGYRINRWIRETMRLTAQLQWTTAKLARREARLQIIANHDQLTGLYNRYYLFDTLEREIHRASRNHLPLSLAMLDIDNFKSYNDDFGHHAGDEVLRALGALVTGSVRATDIVCRFGGEEFLLVFPDTDGLAALTRLQNACRDIKQMRYASQGQELPHVTVCVGLAQYPRHGQTADELICAADRALYLAKKNGRDRIEVLP